MHTKYVAAVLLALALLGTSGFSSAAGTPPSGMHDHGGAMMGGGMMSGEMMRSCPMMGQLPPGNERLAMQMHGEMMKAMGDIMLKYADKIQTPPAK
ncbi:MULTISPECIES: hypothetical protein [Paraburkholderia]|uniref:DUF305 domain-containing protein n=1 Tax=Paraburkholderia madseniana TaxID=2599607 RepID=A0AAP5BPB7_9BURK|nr:MULTISPECIES: hypothetical protein [Paraburkholderia]MCX4151678.1 hypothetical protein [Paraburkholderia madseniana]MCX4176953.1 hypothetical protein [Paraburkholderia madseniana]MDN7154606.1 hypothetical protein [Paraburkholderia sp. WS6]MDQ6413489.1 hypothetical protein [Paraburkholderia madseniana]MDQ6464943.1 hypothetical protein [Paraburkholderia madseniana]